MLFGSDGSREERCLARECTTGGSSAASCHSTLHWGGMMLGSHSSQAGNAAACRTSVWQRMRETPCMDTFAAVLHPGLFKRTGCGGQMLRVEQAQFWQAPDTVPVMIWCMCVRVCVWTRLNVKRPWKDWVSQEKEIEKGVRERALGKLYTLWKQSGRERGQWQTPGRTEGWSILVNLKT